MKLQVTAREHTTFQEGRRVVVPKGGVFEGTENQLKSNPDRLAVYEEAIKVNPSDGKEKVGDVVAKIPEMTDEELEALAEDDERKGVQAAIEKELEKREAEKEKLNEPDNTSGSEGDSGNESQ